MALPPGNWDIVAFDADDSGTITEMGIPPWDTSGPDPVGQIISPGVYQFFDSFAVVARAGETGTVAVKALVRSAFTNDFSGDGFAFIITNDNHFNLVGLGNDGIWASLNGVNTQLVYAIDLSDDFHDIYIVFDTDEFLIYIDGTLVTTVAGFDPGASPAGLTAQVAVANDIDFNYIAVSSEIVIPTGGVEITGDGMFTFGSTITFNVDEFSHNPNVLTASQVLTHYRTGRGLPT